MRFRQVLQNVRRHHDIEGEIGIGDRTDVSLMELGYDSRTTQFGICHGKHRTGCVDAVVVEWFLGDPSEGKRKTSTSYAAVKYVC